jgi:ribonuclease E
LAEVAPDPAVIAQPFVDSLPASAEGSEGAAQEAREGGRRRRRGRGGRDRDDARPLNETEGGQDAGPADPVAIPAEAGMDATAEPGEPMGDDGAPAAEGEREGGRRRNRSRRDRRDDELASPLDGSAPAEASPAATDMAEVAVERDVAAAARTASHFADEAPVQAQAQAPAAAVRAQQQPTAVATVERFVLPEGALHAVAESAGLQWVNSDSEKIRAVQEAMAREPKPVHIPREPRPVVMIDEGPLVLVETRKDLAQFKLPFETSSSTAQASTTI